MGIRPPHRKPPGKTPYRQMANFVGDLIFGEGLLGDLDMAVSSRRVGDATTVTLVYTGGVAEFVVTDSDLERELTPRQLEARRLRQELRRQGGSPASLDDENGRAYN